MPRIFQTVVVRPQVIVTSGDEVDAERLRYDLPETHPDPTDSQDLTVGLGETHPDPSAEEIAAALLVADETHPDPTPAEVADATVLDDATHPDPIVTAELAPQVNETHPDATETFTVELTLGETHPDPTALEQADGTVLDDATSPAPTSAETAGAAVDETHPDPTPTAVIVGTYSLPANAVVSSTGSPGYTSPANAADYDDDEATLTATSTGLTGGTAATASGTLVIGFTDADLGYLTTLSGLTLEVYSAAASSGLALTQPTYSIAIAYSVNSGSSYTTVTTRTAVYDDTTTPLSVDLSGVIGQDPTKVNGLQVRITTSLNSGTGALGAVSASSRVRKMRLTFTASRSDTA